MRRETPVPAVPLLRRRATWIWLFLVAATGLSWWLGTSRGVGLRHHGGVGVAVLAIGFVKARFVALDFMETRHAPLPLRLVMEGWIVAVFVLLAGLFLAG